MMPTNSAVKRPRVGQRVTWLQQRKWGGKQNVPATFQCMARNGLSETSAVIKIDGEQEERTVRLSSLRWENYD
jgi:hypothetical protein